jgi:hypothetical protein
MSDLYNLYNKAKNEPSTLLTVTKSGKEAPLVTMYAFWPQSLMLAKISAGESFFYEGDLVQLSRMSPDRWLAALRGNEVRELPTQLVSVLETEYQEHITQKILDTDNGGPDDNKQ